MKLSDVMSSMGLAGYAEIALVLFLFAFQLVAFDIFRRGRMLESHAWLPFDSTRSRRDARRALAADLRLKRRGKLK